MNCELTLDGFDVSIVKTDQGLLVRAEERPDERSPRKLFYKVITSENIKPFTAEQGYDIYTVYQLIEEYSRDNPAHATLRLDDDGKLTYSCLAHIGSLTKTMGFTVNLGEHSGESTSTGIKLSSKTGLSPRSEVRVASLTTAPGSASKLESTESSITDRNFHAFEKHVMERLDRIEVALSRADERISKLEGQKVREGYSRVTTSEVTTNAVTTNEPEESPLLKEELKETAQPEKVVDKIEFSNIYLEFDPTGPFASHYNFTNSNRTAKMKGETGSEAKVYSVFTTHALPKDKKSKFSFHIESKLWIVVGIAPANAISAPKCYLDPAALSFSHHKHIFKDGIQHHVATPSFYKGDIVTFIVDMTSGELVIGINDKVVYTDILKEDYVKSHDYYPFLSTLGMKDVGATLL